MHHKEMDAVKYMINNSETTKGLRDLSRSLSKLSNDIQFSIRNKDNKYSTVSFQDEQPGYLNNESQSSLRNSSIQQDLHHHPSFPYSKYSSSDPVKTDAGYSTMSFHKSQEPSSTQNSFYRSRTSNRPSSSSSHFSRSGFVEEPVLGISQPEFNAMRYFPVTLGTSTYSMTIPSTSDFEESRSRSPSRHRSRTLSGSLKRKQGSNLSNCDSEYDSGNYKYGFQKSVDKLHALIHTAPHIVAAAMPELSPFEENITKLRLQRLQIEEDRLREIKRRQEIENLRGPEPKWYERKDPSFTYENHKNTQLIRNEDRWDELLKRREELLDESKKMNALYYTTPVF